MNTDSANRPEKKENSFKHPKIEKVEFESNSYGEDMIIRRDRKSDNSNFESNDAERRNFKKGFGDFGGETNKFSRSDKFSKSGRDGDDYRSGNRDFNRKPREFSGERRRDDGDFNNFNKGPRKSFDNRNDSRDYKNFDREDNGFNKRENRTPKFGSSDFSQRDNKPFRNNRDESEGRMGRDKGDRENRERSFGKDRAERQFGERPPRGDRPDRGFEERSPRGDRPDRGFGERPPRGDRSDRGFEQRSPRGGFEDRAPRGDRPDRGFGERPPRGDRPDRGFEDRSPRGERGFGEKPPRGDRGFEDRSPRGDKKDSDRETGDRSFRENRSRPDKVFEERQPKTDKVRSEKSENIFDFEESQDNFKSSANRKSNIGENTSNSHNSDKERTKNFEKKVNFDDITSKPPKENIFDPTPQIQDRNKNIISSPKTENLFSKNIHREKPSESSQEKIDINKMTLANLKLKKDTVSSSVNDQHKEDFIKREEEIVEFRDSKKDYLYGMHSVQAALTYNFRKNLELLIDSNFKENIPDHIQKILELAKAKDVKAKYAPRDKLDKLTGGRPHNGVVLKSDIRDYIYLNNFSNFEKHLSKPESNLLILLDQIVDPQNFGSVIRSAFFLGADAILLNKKNKPPISSTVCKVSSGASECIDLFAVKSLRSFLKESVEKGWTVITTSIEKESDVQMRLDGGNHVSSSNSNSQEQNEVQQEGLEKSQNGKLNTDTAIESKTVSLNELKLENRANVILVLGSEASGITSNITGSSHFNIFIPPMLSPEETGKHPFTLIDSLNVGVSAGIIINHIKSQLKNSDKI